MPAFSCNFGYIINRAWAALSKPPIPAARNQIAQLAYVTAMSAIRRYIPRT